MKYSIFSVETEQCVAQVEREQIADQVSWQVAVTGSQAAVAPAASTSVQFKNGQLQVEVDSARHTFPAHAGAREGELRVATALGTFSFFAQRGVELEGADAGRRAGHATLKSTMPGKVMHILCKKGDHVEAGQPLLVLEAMKMENEIRSTRAGVVGDVSVQVGQKVEAGELLLAFESDVKS